MLKAQNLDKHSTVFQQNLTCTYCHSSFRPGDNVVFCPRDNAIYHEGCWTANGNRCAVHQCGYSEPVTPLYPKKVVDKKQRRFPAWLGVMGWLVAAFLACVSGVLFLDGQVANPVVVIATSTPKPLPDTPTSTRVVLSTPKPPTRTPRTPTRTPAPEFTLRAFDAERDGDMQSLIDTIPDWEGPMKPGHQQWQTTFPDDAPVRLSMGWCAIDQQTLDDNWPDMQYELVIDDHRIDLGQLVEKEWDRQDEGGRCRGYSGVLMEWSPGRHSLIWTHRIYRDLYDGWDAYQSGDYVMEFEVNVR